MGKLERLAHERHSRDLALASRPAGHPKGFVWDQAAGDRVIEFIETYCRHWKGEWAGQLIRLEEWQKWWIRVLFGWKRADGTRRFRKGWVEINRKNAKTTVAAAIALYLLIADNEPGAEVYATATAEAQAKIVLQDAIAMAEASPELSTFVEHLRSKGGTLYCAALKSKMTVLSSESRTKDGLSPHGDIRDEVHEWNDPDLAAKLDTAMGARRQPVTLEITTAGVYDSTSLGWQHHDYAVQILEGLIEDDRQFVFIASVDDDDDPIREADDPKFGVPRSWLKANPNLGVSCKIDFVREQVEEARNRPSEINKVLRLHFGRWTAQVTRWLDVDRWKACEDAAFTEDELVGLECVGGLDLAEKVDLCAFVLVFMREGGGLDLLCRFWLPEAQVAIQGKKGRPFLRQWVDEGWLHATPGEVIDHALIRREINELRARGFKFTEIGFDARSATQVATQLGEEDGFTMVDVRQGTLTLSEPSKLFESKIVERKARATGKPGGPHPVMRWMVGNAVKRTDANMNIAPDKKRSKEKIDGVSAAVTALSRIVGVPVEEKSTGSYLDTEALVIL